MKKKFKGRFALKSPKKWNELINRYFYDPKIESLEILISRVLIKIKATRQELANVKRDLKYGRLTKKAENIKNAIKEIQKEIKKVKYKIKVFKEKKERNCIESKIRKAINYEKTHFTITEMNSIIKKGKIDGRRHY